jgi:DNA-binding LacI/PurR family transcriptional regulator
VRRPTIVDIARLAGVSKGTASYALNGRPGVAERTRARVLAAAEELGWRPSSVARALSVPRVQTVGMVIDRPARTLGIEPFFMELISGVQAVLSGAGVALLTQVAETPHGEIELLRTWWGERRVDAVFLLDLRSDDPRVPVLVELGLPAVVIGGPGHHDGLPGVWSDEVAPIRSAVRYLAGLGHRRIGHVAGRPEFLHTDVRVTAFRDTGRELGLETVSVHTDYTGGQGAAATRSLLSGTARPTALLYDNDVMAVAGAAVAQEMRIPVPAGLSLIAWDDSPLCELVHPPLSALSRDIAGYGADAARTLLAAADGDRIDDFQAPPARLVVRGSTGAAPAP